MFGKRDGSFPRLVEDKSRCVTLVSRVFEVFRNAKRGRCQLFQRCVRAIHSYWYGSSEEEISERAQLVVCTVLAQEVGAQTDYAHVAPHVTFFMIDTIE